MRRLVAAALAACTGLLMALAPVAPAYGAKPVPIGPSGSGDYQHSVLVEQQTDWPVPADQSEWTVNPFPDCSWDIDDRVRIGAAGYLVARSSYASSVCVVSEPGAYVRTVNGVTAPYSTTHLKVSTWVQSSSPELLVTTCWAPQNRCFDSAPLLALDGHYDYTACANAVYQGDDPAVGLVPGSQHGIGVASTVTVTVTNPTNRTVRDVTLGQDVRPSPSACSATLVQDYPFAWSVSRAMPSCGPCG